VLDLESLLELLRQCRPDAVSLMPPPGPDDLPNCPALLAMKTQLESEGVTTVPGAWRIQPSDAVHDTAWRAQALFETRALVAALGEAGTSPLVLEWDAPARGPGDQQALLEFLGPLLEEACRANVRVALRLPADSAGHSVIFREMESAYLGACYDLSRASSRSVREIEALGERLFAVRAGRCWEGGAGSAPWKRWMTALRSAHFSGPLLLDAVRTPVEAGYAVGFVRGSLAMQGAARDAASRIEVI
jgi:sugar phosphate isomerase/epimerase